MTNLMNHLDDRTKARVTDAVAKLRSAIDAGIVPNVLFKDAKDIINRAFEQGKENFLATGPRQPDHGQSVWWSAAYHADALNVTAHLLLTVIKRVSKCGGLKEYSAFLISLVEYAQLLEEAKPLVKKRGELPKVKTQKQIEREADCMTCQCCGRGIFAQTGTIAHHGYERPGTGWQTASCMGAKELPFEVSRDRLGDLIVALGQQIAAAHDHLKAVKNETVKMPFRYQTYIKAESRYGSGRYENHTEMFSRKGFVAICDQVRALKKSGIAGLPLDEAIWDKIQPREWQRGYVPLSFNDLKEDEIERTKGRIHSLNAFKVECQKRYDGWKQTHSHFDKATQSWVTV